VGVLADFHASSLHELIHPAFIASSARFSWNVNVKLSTGGLQVGQFRGPGAEIEKIWKDIYPDDKFGYSFFDQSIAKLYQRDLQTSQLMNWAMGIAIFISCMGLFGLSAFTAQQRTREIGIRKVLGASVAGIANMLCRDFVRLIVIAFFIASPIAWCFMNRWLQGWAYRNDISGWIFVLAGSGAVLIGLLTVGFHAIKAAIANPVKALRSD
jgi:ABC-type antimicrobial peptide transport system permease subunit